MLSVDVDQRPGQSLEHMKRRQIPIQVDTVAAGTGEDAADNELGVVLAEQSGLPETVRHVAGRAYSPRFLFTWPNHRIAVMGSKQLGGVLEIIQRQTAATRGETVDEQRLAVGKAMLEAQGKEQLDAMAACNLGLDKWKSVTFGVDPAGGDEKMAAVIVADGLGKKENLDCAAGKIKEKNGGKDPWTAENEGKTLKMEDGNVAYVVDDNTVVIAGKAWAADVEKLTKDATRIWKDDHDRLHAVGFDDKAILQITLIAAWFNYINRVADALGVGRGET